MAVCRGGGLFPGMKGRFGNAILVPYGDDLILREAPGRSEPRSAEQVHAQDRQRRGAQLWRNLDEEAVAAWAAYAKRNPLPPKADGTPGSTRKDNVFGSLSMRYQLVHGPVAPPWMPPAPTFLGDAIGVSVSPLEPCLTVVADGANAPGVVTQILVQSLAGRNRRTYLEKYVHARIVTFTPDHLSERIESKKGWAAAAYRFIKADTGQATALVEMGKFEVI